MSIIDLDGKWTLKNLKTGKEIPATVPGLNFLDLMESKEIPDPYLAGEEKDYFFVSETPWQYSRTFSVTEEQLNESKCILHFDRLDTLARISIGAKHVGEASNIHRTYDFDVRDFLSVGENEITVTFASLRDYISERQKLNRLPYNAMGTTGHPHIRKSACHFGWDFAPELGMQGISGHCELRFVSQPEIEFLSVSRKYENGEATITAKLTVSGSMDKAAAVFTLTHPSGRSETLKADPENGLEAVFTVKDPEIWWCNGLGEQPLYKITAVIELDGKTVCEKEKSIGIRTIELDRTPYKTGSNFQFVVNGVPIFAKGANYVPMDSLYTRISRERLSELLYKCKEANMNMIRVWGGGFYESDDFYDICDRLGILVWQDCAFACCAYPFMEEAFVDNVREEIKENVSRIMHHASLALWCGNNEIESISMGWLNEQSFIKSTGEFFYHTLPDIIKSIDSETPYHECSPGSGKYMKLPNSDISGDTHIWNVWHGYQSKDYFRKRTTYFCSEFGMQSYPSDSVVPHQKCDMGEERLYYYLPKHFTIPADDNEKRYLTQLLQLEAMKEGVEHFRRHSDHCHGALFWQLNDCWHGVSWAAIDFCMNKKALMFAAKHFNEPIHVSGVYKNSKASIYVSNDLLTAFYGKLSVSLCSENGAEKEKLRIDTAVRANSSKEVLCVDLSGGERIVVMRLYDKSGRLVSENRLLVCDNNRLKLKAPGISVKAGVDALGPYVTVTAENYARYVELSSSCQNLKFEDNYFDLSAGETKKLRLYGHDGCDACADITAFSLYDTMKHKKPSKDLICELKNALIPMAVANRVSRYFDK